MKYAPLLVLLLSACCTDTLVKVCPALSNVSNETRLQLADEMSRFPQGSAAGWAVKDWLKIRAEITAGCKD